MSFSEFNEGEIPTLDGPSADRNLILVGFSGTGKSTVGRLLAARLGRRFVDTDDMIVERFGKAIDRVFADDGEPAFRRAEREEVSRAVGVQGQVVSVGGGAVADVGSRDLIVKNGLVVHLKARPETIIARLRSDCTERRPMLESEDPLGRVTQLLAARASAYSCAHLILDTDGRTPDECVDLILRWIASCSGVSPKEVGL